MRIWVLLRRAGPGWLAGTWLGVLGAAERPAPPPLPPLPGDMPPALQSPAAVTTNSLRQLPTPIIARPAVSTNTVRPSVPALGPSPLPPAAPPFPRPTPLGAVTATNPAVPGGFPPLAQPAPWVRSGANPLTGLTFPALPGPGAYPTNVAGYPVLGAFPPSPVGTPVIRSNLFPPRPYQPLQRAQQEGAFAWDALVKEYTAKAGDLTNRFTFSLTNISGTNVTIQSVRTSCGCTIAKLPAVPWQLSPGSNGTFEVLTDLRGKIGVLTKTVTIDSSAGYRFLTVRVSIPSAGLAPSTTAADRARNMQVAMVDRQAVFKGDCSACHLQPVMGKKEGDENYNAICGVCHEAQHRASMVPNLRALNQPTDREFWHNLVTKGKPGTLMPAFAIAEGGPLTDAQIQSLVEFLNGPSFHHPSTPARAPQQVATPKQRVIEVE